MDYETEEQQVEALKRWWSENGRAVIAGVVLGGAGIGGWQLWQHRAETQAVAASDGWSRTLEAVSAGDAALVASQADTLADDYDNTLYAAYAQLAAARAAIEADDLDTAATRLTWAMDNAVQDDVKLIARVRLARVEGARGAPDTGLALLPSDYPEAFTGLIEEARGDLAALADDPDAARAAYELARDSGQVADPNALTMKLDALAVPSDA